MRNNLRWKRREENQTSKLTKQKGELVEMTLLLPIYIMLIFFTIIFDILILDYNSMNFTAQNLASEMNMGDSGYKNHVSSSNQLSVTSYQVSETSNIWEEIVYSNVSSRKTMTVGRDIQVTPGQNDCFKNTFMYYLTSDRYNQLLNQPFMTVTNISCRPYFQGVERTDFNTNSGSSETGDLICVDIAYRFMGITLHAIGLSYIV
jgi:hypothetical protein